MGASTAQQRAKQEAAAEQPQNQVPPELIAAVAVLLLSDVAAGEIADTTGGLLEAAGIATVETAALAASAAIGLVLPHAAPPSQLTLSRGNSEAWMERTRIVRHAAFVVNAARRLARERDQLATQLSREQTYLRLHLAAERGRADAARKVDLAMASYGSILGWYAVHDDRTDPICKYADGHNFSAYPPPSVGLPGAVHGFCRCIAGPPHDHAMMLDLSEPHETVRLELAEPWAGTPRDHHGRWTVSGRAGDLIQSVLQADIPGPVTAAKKLVQRRAGQKAAVKKEWNALTPKGQDNLIGVTNAIAVREERLDLFDVRGPAAISDALAKRRGPSTVAAVRGRAKWRRAGIKAAKSRREAAATAGAPDAIPADENSMPGVLVRGQITEIKPMGGGVSDSYTGRLEDGTKVVIKNELDYPGLRDNIDEKNGLEHSQAAVRLCDYLGLPTPRCIVRRADSLDDRARGDLGNPRPNARIGVQEFLEGIEPLRDNYLNAAHGTPEEAQLFHVLDYVIGNSDRHIGNWARHNGRLVAIDHDLSFPVGKSDGNAFAWTDEAGNPLAGTPIPNELQAKIDGIIEHRAEWRRKLLADGITPAEVDAMMLRVEALSKSKTFRSHDDYLGYAREWAVRFKGGAKRAGAAVKDEAQRARRRGQMRRDRIRRNRLVAAGVPRAEARAQVAARRKARGGLA